MVKKVFLFLIRLYQLGISPYIGPHCRFTPTCSRYAYEAIQKYGALKGGYLAVRRLSGALIFLFDCADEKCRKILMFGVVRRQKSE